jgi:ankyrin repeat protein
MNLVRELQAAITNGSDLNARDQFGATPLHYAIAEKNSDVIELLLTRDADVTAQDADGLTALHCALEHELTHVAKDLIEKNPRVIGISDKYGNQPLWTAVFNAIGNYELVALLLDNGADPNHRNNADRSPLDLARRKGDAALIEILESKSSGKECS